MSVDHHHLLFSIRHFRILCYATQSQKQYLYWRQISIRNGPRSVIDCRSDSDSSMFVEFVFFPLSTSQVQPLSLSLYLGLIFHPSDHCKRQFRSLGSLLLTCAAASRYRCHGYISNTFCSFKKIRTHCNHNFIFPPISYKNYTA